MVNKNLELVDALSFADAHIQYPDRERNSIYNEIFREAGFDKPDLILLTGGPSEEEEQKRRELTIDYLNELSGQKVPELLTTPSHRMRLQEDDRIGESDYIIHLMEPNSSLDEIESARRHLEAGDNIAVVTTDYHVPRIDKRLNSALSDEWQDTRENWGATLKEFLTDPEYGNPTNDYIVLGADFDENEANYGNKWISEAIRTALPQKAKDLGKKYILDDFTG